MTKTIITLVTALIAIALLLGVFFIRSYSSYGLENGAKINNEIATVDCFFSEDGEELFVGIVKCDAYGKDNCVNGQKVADGTLQVIPYVGETGDTLKFVRRAEGSWVYKCPATNDCWKGKLHLSLTYKFDSLDNRYDRRILLSLHKRTRFGFSVH